MRCAFLTLSDPTGWVIDDDLAYEPLEALGWRVEAVPWNRPGVAWGEYDLVVIRSSWDYHHAPEEFLAVLAEIERSGARLENPLDLVRWNLDKNTYLHDLAKRGVTTVPTFWQARMEPGELQGIYNVMGSPQIVVKPAVGASAEGVFRLDRPALRRRAREVEAYFAERALLAQPFARAVLDEGEYSLFYFGGELSHAISKRPKPGDFRVQEEHGGIIRRIEPEGDLLAAGTAALGALDVTPLYARVDLVRSNNRKTYWLMELELIEPSLYLRMDAEAPGRFARALHARMEQCRGLSERRRAPSG